MTPTDPRPSTLPHSVEVSAPARLHLGFLDLQGGLGRRFGSLGLALDRPCTRITLERAPASRAAGPEAARALSYAQSLQTALKLPQGIALRVEQAIPSHVGLGSGTQLALAVGVGIAHLYGTPLSAYDIARLLGRGARSGIGIATFERGGFLVDGGRTGGDKPPPLTVRLPVPERWRFLLVFDAERRGVSGASERQAFTELPLFPESLSGELCRLLVLRALPALTETDIHGFGSALTAIQQRVGDYFAPLQGGRYTSPAVAEALSWLNQRGAAGVGQSSWGPTGFALCADAEQAGRLRDLACRRWLQRPNLRFLICQARNRAASVRVNYSLKSEHHVQAPYTAYANTRR